MLAAQDMFKNANRVTRPEKALILGFMAGSRGIFILRIHTINTRLSKISKFDILNVTYFQIILVRIWEILSQSNYRKIKKMFSKETTHILLCFVRRISK